MQENKLIKLNINQINSNFANRTDVFVRSSHLSGHVFRFCVMIALQVPRTPRVTQLELKKLKDVNAWWRKLLAGR